jgi:hypothetical protein
MHRSETASLLILAQSRTQSTEMSAAKKKKKKAKKKTQESGSTDPLPQPQPSAAAAQAPPTGAQDSPMPNTSNPPAAKKDDPAPAKKDDPAPARKDDPAPAKKDDPAPAKKDDPAPSSSKGPGPAGQTGQPTGQKAVVNGASTDAKTGVPVAPRPTSWGFEWALILFALSIGFALIAAYFVTHYLTRREREDFEDAQRAIGEALGRPDLSIADAAKEINSINRLTSSNYEKNVALDKSLKEANERLKRATLGGEERRAAAVTDCLNDAAKAAEALADDADFQALGQALELVTGLRRCAEALSKLPGGSSVALQLGSLLEKGELDTALTASAVLENYFAERPDWRDVRIALRAADALLVSLLQTVGIQVVDVPILSVVGRNDIRGAAVSDRRGLRSIPTIQQRAARIARDLAPSELLVVDCHRPGWISDKIGSRPPGLAIFDPASWT